MALALLLAAGACDPGGGARPVVTPSSSGSAIAKPNATPTPTAKPTPTPTPTKTPFVWKLLLDGGSSFAGVKGVPVGSICMAKAFLKSGLEISGPAALKPRTVTSASLGASWTEGDGGHLLTLPNPAPPSRTEAYWQITCINNAFNPPSGRDTKAFTTP